jgi:hypothetical protein
VKTFIIINQTCAVFYIGHVHNCQKVPAKYRARCCKIELDDEAWVVSIAMAESLVEQDHSEVEYDDDFWDSADINDFFHELITWAPQRCWLELSGDPTGLHFAPFLCVCIILKIRFDRMVEILGKSWGSQVKSSAIMRLSRTGSLKCKDKKARQPIWIWVDRTCLPPPSGSAPGISRHF